MNNGIRKNVQKHLASLHKPNNGWFSNAVKSMGLSSGALIKDLAPSMYEFTTSASKDAMVLSKNMRAQNIGVKKISDSIQQSQYYKFAKDLLRNSMDDIKSGKFVNPEREKKMDEEFEKSILGDFQDSISEFDDLGFGIEDEGEASVQINNNNFVEGDSGATVYMAQAMQTNSETQVKMAEAQINTMISVASNSLLQAKQIGDGILSSLSSINDNLSAMIEYNNENMTKYIEASLAYYSQTAPKKQEDTYGDYNNNKTVFSDLFGSKGTLNIGEYGKYIKQNLKKSYSDSMFGSMFDIILEHPEMVLGSPVQFLMTGAMKSFVPKVLKNSLKNLDNSFSNFFPTLLGKVADMEYSENGILSNIGKVAGAKQKRATKFKLNKIERGAIPFDGMTKHAIVEIIPTYLRKILSSLSGKEEIAYNWDKGKYQSVGEMKNDIYNSIRDNTIDTFKYSKLGDKLSSNKELLVDKDADKFEDLLDKFYIALERSNKGFFNPMDDSKDQFKGVMTNIDDLYGKELGNLLRASFKTLDKSELMSVNKLRNDAKRERKDTIDAMQYDPYYYGTLNLADDDSIDEEIDKRQKANIVGGNGRHTKKYKSEILNYLSDIEGILLRGINVKINGFSSSFDNTFDPANPGVSVNNNPSNTPSSTDASTTPDSSFDEYRQSQGMFTQSVSGRGLSTQDMVDKINTKRNIESTDIFGDTVDPNAENTSTTMGNVRDKLRTVANPVAKSMDKTNNFLYGLIFGSSSQLFDNIALNIADKLTVGFEWIKTKIFNPLKDAILGEKDENGYMQSGILKNLQNTTKDFMNEAMRSFSGHGYINAKGEKVEDMDTNKSIVGKVRNVFSTIKEDTLTYLFGEKDPDTGERSKEGKDGLISNAKDSIMDGFRDFRELLFGKKEKQFDENGNEIIKSFKDEVMEKMPKTVSGMAAGVGVGTVSMLSGTGILGSLFLPGGPISGAILGSALGFVSQSEKFKEVVFGKDDVDGNHIEGLISKKTQDFFKENKKYITGGAAFGVLKSAVFGGGLMGSLMFGPFTGAIMGAGLGILKRSNAVQEILYGKGEEGEEGYKKGIIKAFKDKVGTQDFKKAFGMGLGGATTGFLSASAIGQMGIIGSMLTPFGPLGGAIMGSAIGIASTNDKVKNFLFGEMNDETNKREGGLIGKVKNYVSIELFQPLKLKMQEMGLNVSKFLDEKLAEPVRRAVEPFAHQMKLVGQTIKDKFFDITDKIVDKMQEHVIQPISENLNKYLLDPIKKLSSTLFNGFFSILGSVISAPFSLLSVASGGLANNHKSKALDNERDNIWASNDPNKGFFGNVGSKFVKTFKNYGTKSGRETAYANQAPYLVDYEEGIKERENERRLKYTAKAQELENAKNEYSKNQAYARKTGYNDIDSRNDIGEENENKGRLFSNVKNWLRSKHERDDERQIVKENNDIHHQTRQTQSAVVESQQADIVDKENDKEVTEDANSSNKSNSTKGKTRRQKRRERRASRRSANATIVDTSSVLDDNDVSDNSTDIESSTNNIKNNIPKILGVRANKASKNSDYNNNMIKYVKDIRDEIKGQFNGVGLNIFKIRKILNKKLGVSDNGTEGSDNLEGLSLIDKIGNFLQRPIKNLSSIIMKPFAVIGETIGKVKQGFVDFVTGIKEIPKKIISGIGSGIKATFNFITDTAKIAGGIIKDGLVGVYGTIKTGVKAIGALGSAVIKGTGAVVEGIAVGLGSMVGGIAKGIGKVAETVPKLVGATVEAIGSIGAGIIKGIGSLGKATLDVINGGLKILATGVKEVVNIAAMAGKALINVLTTPIKLMASFAGNIVGGIGDFIAGGKKKRQKIEFQGGFLTEIEKPVKIINANKPIDVRVVETTKEVPVNFTSEVFDKLGNTLKSIFGGSNGVNGTSTQHTPGMFDSIMSNFTGEPNIVNDTMNNTIPPDGINNTDASIMSSIHGGVSNIAGGFIKGKDIIKGAFGSIFKNKNRGSLSATPVQRTAENEKQRRKEVNAETTFDNREAAKVSLLQRIKESTSEHMLNWKSIFSKKGLITGSAIMMFPLLMKFLKKIGGFDFLGKIGGAIKDTLGNVFQNFNDGGGIDGTIDRTREEISNWSGNTDSDSDGYVDGDLNKNGKYSFGERIRQFYTGGDKDNDPDTIETDHETGAKLNITRRGAAKLITNSDKIKNSKVTKFVATQGKRLASATISGGKKLIQSDGVKNIASTISNSKAGTNLVAICTKSLDFLKEKLLKVISKYSSKAKPELIEKMFTKIAKLLKPEVLIKYGTKFTAVLGKAATAAGTLLTSEIFWAGTGAIVGAATASNLFQIDEIYIDDKMRAISAVFRGLLNTSVGSVIDIINEIVYELMGTNFVSEVALIAYKAISSKEDGDAAQQAREQFDQDYRDYTSQQEDDAYQKYLAEHPEAIDNEETKKQFLSDNKISTMSKADFNEERHQGFFKKASNTYNEGVKWFKKTTGQDTSKEDAELTDATGQHKANLFTGMNLGTVTNTLTTLASPVQSLMKYTGIDKYYKEAEDYAATKLQEGLEWFKGGVTDDNYVRKAMGLQDDEQITTRDRISVGLGSFLRASTFGKADVDDAKIGTAIDKIQKTAEFAWNNKGPILSKAVENTFDWFTFGVTDDDKVRKAMMMDDNENVTIRDRLSFGLSNAIKVSTLGKVEVNPTSIDASIKTFANNAKDLWNNRGTVMSELATNAFNWFTNDAYTDDAVRNQLGLDSGDSVGNKDRMSVFISRTISHMTFGKFKPKTTAIKSTITKIQTKIHNMWSDFTNKVTKVVGDIKGIGSNLTTWITTKIKNMFGLSDEDTKAEKLNISSNLFTNVVGTSASKIKSVLTGSGDSEYTHVGGGSDESDGVYYSQKQGPWADMKYGTDKTISDVGCGPTTAAMLISNVTGKNVTPIETAEYAQRNGYVVNNKGTSWDYFNTIGNQYGVNMDQTSNFNDVESALSSGRPVVLTGNGGNPYTKGGHYIMANGFDEKGNIVVSDPLGKERNKSYSPSLLKNMTTQAWVSENQTQAASGKMNSNGTPVGLSLNQASLSKLSASTDASYDDTMYDDSTYDDSDTELTGGEISKGDMVVQSARKLVGLPYVYGGNYKPLGSSQGTDCSGLCQWAYNDAFGQNIPRTTQAQLSGLKKISGSELMPGDLIYPNSGHVFMYAGNNKVIEAQKTGTKISEHDYTRKGTEFRRVLDNPSQMIAGSSMDGESTREGGVDKSDLFGAIGEFLGEFGSRAFNGILTGDYNSDYDSFFNGTVSGSSSSTSGIANASNLEDEIALKTLDIIRSGEGDYDTVVAHDVDAFSFGRMGFHKTAAKEVLNRIAAKLSGSDAKTAKEFASYTNRSLTSAEASRLKSFLNKAGVKPVNEQVQLQYAMELIKSQNLPTLMAMLKDGRLKDPRSAVLVADIGNSGPAHISKWAKNYKPVANKSEELAHVYQSLKSADSYWGQQASPGAKQHNVYNGWMNRIDKAYSNLQRWQPKYGAGEGSEYGAGDGKNSSDLNSVNLNDMIKNSNPVLNIHKHYGAGDQFNSKEKSAINVIRKNYGGGSSNTVYREVYKDTYKPTRLKYGSGNAGTNLSVVESLLERVSNFLEKITNNSTNSLDALKQLKTINNITAVKGGDNTTPVIVNSNNGTQQANIGGASKNELLARKIAKGAI